ncbi:MAG TPA: cyclic nucleotide-binding domain-containing protein [Ktedonobacteraceae bacterium]|jgi:CRP/FNR family cyclic AMP-dependent transcriptional regulator|nr:cyclic nucleotide-binding domain-containing protein [Ktedonobacteraceae bacterium]
MYEDTLANVPLFSSLDRKELRELARSVQERTYSPGSVIIKQGDTGVGLYIITKGTVHITQVSNPDRPEEDLGTAGTGEVIGEMALLDDLPRSATITAVDEVTALLLPVWEFRTAMRNSPDIAIKLLSVLSRRLRNVEKPAR